MRKLKMEGDAKTKSKALKDRQGVNNVQFRGLVSGLGQRLLDHLRSRTIFDQ